MSEIIGLIAFIVIVSIALGVAFSQDNISEGLATIIFLCFLALIVNTIVAAVISKDVQHELAVELYTQGKPMSKYQARLVIDSDVYNEETPIILIERSTSK